MANPRRKTLVLIGHSNAEGWAGTNDLFEAAPHLQPSASPYWDIPSTRNVYPGIYVATNAIDWPSPSGTPGLNYDIDDVSWQPMTHNLPDSPAAPHPLASPYTYPNIRGAWYPHHYHDSSGRSGDGTFCGVEIPLMWRLSHYWPAPNDVGVGLVKMTISSSLFLRFDSGGTDLHWTDVTGLHATYPPGDPARPASTVDPAFGYFVPWWTPSDKFDWAPTTGRLYSLWKQKMAAAKLAMPSGIDMDVDTIVIWAGDNDSANDQDSPVRTVNWETECRKFVAQIRKDCFDNQWTLTAANKIKIVWMGVATMYGSAEVIISMNEALEAIEDDDPYFRFISTYDGQYNSALGYSDPYVASGTHFSCNAYIEFADQIAAAIEDMDVYPYDALDTDDCLTVEQLRDRVRLYYSRGKVNTDIDDEMLLQHINGSMHHVLHQCGDQAWFLRRRMSISLTGGGTASPITLPRHVHRILHIEEDNDVTTGVKFEMIGHQDGGKLQIVMPGRSSGDYTIHFIRYPQDLEGEQELVPIPSFLLEWVVVETCFRLARAAANPLQIAAFQGEAMRLQADVLKSLATTQRAKRDRLYTQRRLPDVLHRNRYRRWDNL